jgi:hypothetical protein
VLLSVNVPTAVNCCVNPFAIEEFVGVTAMETSAGAVTLKLTGLLATPPDVAVRLDAPTARAVARPEALTVATAVFEEFQVAVLVRFCVLLSVNVPVAVNC